ncbi:MAG: hypothetical protein ABI383_08320, partial [Acidobacteriaceae bacterium]
MLDKAVRFIFACVLLISSGLLFAQTEYQKALPTEYQKVLAEAKKQVRKDYGLVLTVSPDIILAIQEKPFTATCVYAPYKVWHAGKIVERAPLRAKIARDSVGRIYKEQVVAFSVVRGYYLTAHVVKIYDPVKQVEYTVDPEEQDVIVHDYRMQFQPIPNTHGAPPPPTRMTLRGKPSVDLGVDEIEGFTAYRETVERPLYRRARSNGSSSSPEIEEIDEWFSPELAIAMKNVWKQKGRIIRSMEVTDI